MRSLTQIQSINLLPEINTLLNRIPLEYLRDFAFDLAKVALITPRHPNAIAQLIAEWEVTLEEIEVAGDEMSDILQARQEAQHGIGMTPDQLRAYLASEEV